LERVAAGGVHLGDLASADYTDVYRAAWVQAIGALDHWLHKEIVARVIATVNDTAKPRPPRLQQLAVPWSVVEQATHRPTDEVLREYLSDRLGRDSFQKADRISEGLGYVTLKKQGELWREVAQILGDGLTAETVKQRQDEYADRRNKIAHEADLPDGSPDRRPVAAAEAGAVIDWVASLAAALRSVLG
jgi:hypothetical protein